MRYFKCLNIQRQKVGPFVVTEEGLKNIKSQPQLSAIVNVIGECDFSGNLLTDVAKQNFTTEPKQIPQIFNPTQNGTGTNTETGNDQNGTAETSRKKPGPKPRINPASN
jgi:hypothetical protein